VRTPARDAIETFGTGGGNQSQTLSDGRRTIRLDRQATPETARYKIAAGIFSDNFTHMISPNQGKTSSILGPLKSSEMPATARSLRVIRPTGKDCPLIAPS
jgi:hypothetical protein